MNKRDRLTNRQKVLDLFKSNSISGKQGYVKIWGDDKGHCRDSHELVKFLVCKKLRFIYGCEIWTEVEFKNNNGRGDILCIDKSGNGNIIEILDSESNEKFNIKLDKYPLPVCKIETKNFDINKWCL